MEQRHHPLLSASLGSQREIISFHFGPRHARQVYIQAALHGDELPGMAVAWYLKRRLQELESAGQLNAAFTLVPVANPLALGQHWQGAHLGRYHALSGQDFNRNFPQLGSALAEKIGQKLTLSEQENKRLIREAIVSYFRQRLPQTELEAQRFVLMEMACQADLMIDLHCDWEAVPHLYTTPQAWPFVEPLARWLGSEVQLLAEISGGEPFDESCLEPWQYLQQRFGKDFPLPSGLIPVTLELRGVRDVSPELAQRDADAIIAALTQGGYIAGNVQPSEVPPLRNEATPLQGCEYLHAPHAGLILHRRQPGERVLAGEVVAEIVDPLTDKVTPLISEFGGLIYARHWTRFATAGMLVVRLAGKEAHRSGSLLAK